MHNIDAKTPQLMVIKRLFDAYCTRDTRNVLPLLAKGFISQSFPKSPELPDEAKGELIEKWGEIQSLFIKVEVRIWRWEPPSHPQPDISDTQIDVHEIIEAPGKVVSQLCLSMQNSHLSCCNMQLQCSSLTKILGLMVPNSTTTPS